MKKKSWLIFAYFCLFLNVSAQRNLSAISLVPQKSAAVLRVNWTQVRGNEKLRAIVNGDNFEKIENELGVSGAKISEWIIFSDINPSTSAGMGIIISGSFTSNSVIQTAKAKNWKAEKMGANTVFVNPSDKSYLLPIRNGLLVFGTKSGVEKLHGVLVKPQNNLISKPPFNSTWAELTASRQPINFMIGVPQEYQKVADIAYKVAAKLMDLASFGIMGTVMETIGLVRCMGFSISHQKNVYPTNLVAMMETETKAWLTSGAINLLKKAPSAIGTRAKTEEEKQMLKSMQTMSASYRGTLLSVKFDMPENALRQR